MAQSRLQFNDIRIEPQWNVNWKDKYSNTNVLDQNRTIVECKYDVEVSTEENIKLEQNHSGM